MPHLWRVSSWRGAASQLCRTWCSTMLAISSVQWAPRLYLRRSRASHSLSSLGPGLAVGSGTPRAPDAAFPMAQTLVQGARGLVRGGFASQGGRRGESGLEARQQSTTETAGRWASKKKGPPSRQDPDAPRLRFPKGFIGAGGNPAGVQGQGPVSPWARSLVGKVSSPRAPAGVFTAGNLPTDVCTRSHGAEGFREDWG